MEKALYECKQMGPEETEAIKKLFLSVFTAEPWKDDWSDQEQFDSYIHDLTGHSNSLTYGLYAGGELTGVSMGNIRHWYTGTEYYIDEFCIRPDRQGWGLGTLFLKEIEKDGAFISRHHLLMNGKSVLIVLRCVRIKENGEDRLIMGMRKV